jgi:uncharacterized protein (TIGR02246 family)
MAEDARDRDEIEAILADQSAAWAAGDAHAFAAAATDDVSFTNVMGMYTIGIEPFRVQHARIFATIYKGSKMTQTVERIAFVTADVAVVDTLTTLGDVTHLPPGFAPGDGIPKSRLQQVLVKKSGAWRVAAFHNVFVNPAFQGPPPAS